MNLIEGGVCAPGGFYAGGIRCGIKAAASKRDLALVYSKRPCTSAAVFTANRVQAANITVSREHCRSGAVRALIANSGNANACTGEAGLEAARRMASGAAKKLGIPAEECAVASTGVIGVPLPIERIEGALDELAASAIRGPAGAEAALEAIMTTDTRKKSGVVAFALPSLANKETVPVTIGAMCKGSGMIHPNMATMICVITTDAAVSTGALDGALRRAVNRSFNRLTVDGDMSTNDMAIIMANGQAGNVPLERDGPGWDIFAASLEELCVSLARQMARDGEGATRLMTVTVKGAESEEAAAVLARSVAASNLVKAALFGADANWGRVLCALGYARLSGGGFNPEETSVAFASPAGKIEVFRRGSPLSFSEERAKTILREEEIDIEAVVGTGSGEASAWGCDLSYDYVKINGDYRS
ncbi:MAG: bifunctional glutamate N-acetyltransferase/amino-acid acetyltransferase ArgJ [Treponema sp.]|jgi:glutamate N-acetyltransferase/amino-acid N-acetyltransferase|nr:bifunctional glutamate N-acetyltransferase/amino-acid acetyltransferase ArgJ [Treponema sp.]